MLTTQDAADLLESALQAELAYKQSVCIDEDPEVHGRIRQQLLDHYVEEGAQWHEPRPQHLRVLVVSTIPRAVLPLSPLLPGEGRRRALELSQGPGEDGELAPFERASQSPDAVENRGHVRAFKMGC